MWLRSPSTSLSRLPADGKREKKKIFPSCRLAVVNLPGKGGQPLDIKSRTMNHEAAVILGKGQNGIRKLDDFKHILVD